MRLWNFIPCNLLQICFGLILVQYITCECLFPHKDFPNGRIKYQFPDDVNSTYADDMYILQFVCYPGYYRVGPKYIQCVDDDWTEEVPICAIMECSDPPAVENAKYVLKSGVSNSPTLGSSAVYTCKVGYELDDDDASTLKCTLGKKSRMAKWIGTIPVCKEKKSCPDPGVSNHGSRVGKCCFSGSALRFSCDDGYELVGNNTIHCLSSGIWSSARPLCRPIEDHCELPPKISHGVVAGEKEGDYFLPDEEAQIVCEPGYVCKGPEFVVCEEGGEWETEFGECTEIVCDPPPPLPNGIIPELLSTNQTSFPYYFVLTYICDKNYRLIGDSWRVCGKRGWSGKAPYCEVTQCPDPGMPENGNKIGSNYTVGSSVFFSCFDGYELLGSVERYCMPNGQWTGELSRCDLSSNYCPNPGIPIKGSKNSTNYDLGVKVGFRCQDGYIQLGSEVRECLKDHTWSGTETKCLGPYDYDNGAHVRDLLKESLAEKVEDQKKELQKYQETLHSTFLNGSMPRGRVLDLNYPGRLILYFAFDVSGSVGPINFARSIEFAKAIVKKVGISEHGARAGALIFSSEAEEMFLPLNFDTTEGVLNALDKINYTGGGTAASSAFSLIRTSSMPLVEANLGKINIKSAIFLLTDGKANMGGSPAEEAEILKQAGVEIYCIGITGDVRKKTLYDLASKSKNAVGEEYSNVYILQNYDTLSWLVQEITNGTVDYSECGLGLETVGSSDGRARVVGGRKSKHPWPWMAALFMQTGKDNPPRYKLKCGGSIINRHFILTAAHCMFENLHANPKQRNKNSIIIKLGLTDTKNETYVQESEIMNMFIHPKYRAGHSFDYDIALLQLERPVEYKAFVRPVCLPPKELPEDSPLYCPRATAWATGWGHEGKVSRNEMVYFRTTQSLKEVYLPIQTRERCLESTINQGIEGSVFTERMFCAGDGKGGNDTCHGDSGGPLMQSQLNSDGYLYWTQVGIVSWGIGCGLKNTYGYYTYLQRLEPWVEDTIENALREQ